MKDLIKNIFMISMATGAIFLISCNEDGDGDANPAYDFKDQNLQGKIDGLVFNFSDARVESSNEELSFDLYSDQETEAACDLFLGDFVQVFFSIPNEVGLVELSFDLSSFSGQTITMYNPDGSNNIIATEGAVEITEITETTVSGRMDIQVDDNSFVNGNFIAEFCP